MKIILFEDKKINNLYPVTLTRPVFDIMCGGLNLYGALKTIFTDSTFDFYVRDYLLEVASKRYGADNTGDNHVLFINASLVPDLVRLKELQKKIKDGKDFIVKDDSGIVAVYVADLSIYVKFNADNLLGYLDDLKLNQQNLDLLRFQNLWDIIVYNKEILKSNLEVLSKNFKNSKEGVFIGGNVAIADNVVFDSSCGPIIIDADSKVESFVELKGSLYIGQSSIVKSFSKLENSTIGDVSKVGGEVEASIIQGYSNKQHYGFLGHSYIGEWVNIGAGTANSDLKNTYGKIKMDGINTDQQFLGCVIADYAKVAVNTTIYTGKIIGVSGFIYSDVTVDVPSFTNLLPNKKMIECPLDIAHKIQSAVRDRRKVETAAVDEKLLAQAFDLTKDDRKKYKVKKGKLEI